jgi:hypothetical protein
MPLNVVVARLLVNLRVFFHESRILAVLQPLEGEEGSVKDQGVQSEGERRRVTRVGSEATYTHEELAGS